MRHDTRSIGVTLSFAALAVLQMTFVVTIFYADINVIIKLTGLLTFVSSTFYCILCAVDGRKKQLRDAIADLLYLPYV
jgi:hypothetical protein